MPSVRPAEKIDMSDSKELETEYRGLLDVLRDAVHELPAGVLWGHDGATEAQCGELMKDLNRSSKSVISLVAITPSLSKVAGGTSNTMLTIFRATDISVDTQSTSDAEKIAGQVDPTTPAFFSKNYDELLQAAPTESRQASKVKRARKRALRLNGGVSD